ncbi:MAG: DUF481 domain-containing protein [Planctomycetota bacterium]
MKCSSMLRLALVSVVAGGVCGGAAAQEGGGQTPADLARALAAAGVELPAGFVINEDGSVTVPEAVAAEVAAAEVAAAEAAAASAPGSVAGIDTPVGEDIMELAEASWDNKIDLSLALTDGNSENTSFRLAYDGLRTGKRELSELSLDASYSYATTDGEDEVNEATFGVNHDWLFKESRWLAFAGGRLDWDMFRSWRYRVNANGGVGYKFIDREKFRLVGRAGGGLTREFGSDNDDIIPEGLLGLDMLWQLAENQSLEASTRYYPDLSDINQFRVVSTVDWRLDLDDVNDGLGLVAGLAHEHQSEVDPGVRKNDVQVFAGLTWDF